MIERRITDFRDAAILAPRLRAEDKAELLALGYGPLEALQESVMGSAEAFTWWKGNDIVAMAGVIPETAVGPAARPWMLGSDLVPQNARYFLPESRRIVERWWSIWPILWNVIDHDYKAALRWIVWLGFSLREPQPIGTGLFQMAVKERAC